MGGAQAGKKVANFKARSLDLSFGNSVGKMRPGPGRKGWIEKGIKSRRRTPTYRISSAQISLSRGFFTGYVSVL